MKFSLFILAFAFGLCGHSQYEPTYLRAKDIKKDLNYLDGILQSKSSYQGLNGYDYRKDFVLFLDRSEKKPVTAFEFGLFLSKTIGKIGDRHSYIKGYTPRDSLFFPLAFAPLRGDVAVLNYHRENDEFSFWNSDFPYLHSIQDIPIEVMLPQVLPGEELAPKASHQLRAVRDLRDVETIFRILGVDLVNPVSVTLKSKDGEQMTTLVKLVPRDQRAMLWDERFYRKIFRIKEEKYNDKAYVDRFFKVEGGIATIQIASMLDREEIPVFFGHLTDFMDMARRSEALIVDVRDNDGGTRDLIQELAGYFVHPDSIYVGNVVKQRGKQPLNKELRGNMHSRYLYARNELEPKEQKAVDRFMSTFGPMYELDAEKFSQYHYYMLNGQKLSEGKYHYRQPVYILCNERSFSAASVLVAVFKDLPNIEIVGINTDGSSGNSQRFTLPKSAFRGKISTMVSFQKDGRVLDGIGTSPDTVIERNVDQIFWKEDYQLVTLREMIKNR